MTKPVVTKAMVSAAVTARAAYWNTGPLPDSDASMDRMETASIEAAILAALRLAPSPWRPIGEHDGSDEPVLIGRGDSIRWAVWSGGFWRDGQESAGGKICGCPSPTHFQPLPQPPGDE